MCDARVLIIPAEKPQYFCNGEGENGPFGGFLDEEDSESSNVVSGNARTTTHSRARGTLLTIRNLEYHL